MGSKQRTLLAIMVVIVTTIFLHHIGALGKIENALLTPLDKLTGAGLVAQDSVRDQLDKLQTREELQEQVQVLEKQLNKKRIDEARLQILEHENEQLLRSISYTSTTGQSIELARAIGRNIDPLGSSLIIDKGQAHGIAEGNAVLSGESIIGSIVKVAPQSAIVRLINDSQSRLPATILNTERSIGIVEGGFGIAVRMKFIPQNEIITPGDLIVTSGLDGTIPHGLVIGTVETVDRKPQEPFQEAILRPITNLNTISLISVITDYRTTTELVL